MGVLRRYKMNSIYDVGFVLHVVVVSMLSVHCSIKSRCEAGVRLPSCESFKKAYKFLYQTSRKYWRGREKKVPCELCTSVRF